MPPLPRAARRIDVATYYTEYVPSLWNAALEGVTLPVFEVAVALIVDGQSFVMQLRGTALSVTTAQPPDVLLASCSFDREAWQVGTRDIGPKLLSRLEAQLDRARATLENAFRNTDPITYVDGIADLEGTLVVTYTDDAGDEVQMTITIGDGGTRRATLALSDDDLRLVMSGKATIGKLLKSRAELGGDAGFLLQLLNRLDPR